MSRNRILMRFWPNWNINEEGRLEYDGWQGPERPVSILHLDDQVPVRYDFSERLIEPFFPGARIMHVDNGDYALEWLMEYLEDKRHIDLFVTDISHPGINGIRLVQLIRKFEQLMGREKRLPIMIYSNWSRVYVEVHYMKWRSLPVDYYYLKCALREEQTGACSDFIRKLEELWCS